MYKYSLQLDIPHYNYWRNMRDAGKRKEGGTGSGAAAFTPDGARLPGDTLLFFPSLGPAY